MSLFKKKPIEVEGFEITWANAPLLQQRFRSFTWTNHFGVASYDPHYHFHVDTQEGPTSGHMGDWVLIDVEGHPYICKRSVFEATYEAVE